MQVLGHFGEKFDLRDCHRMCDNCVENADTIQEDMTTAAQDAINLVRSLLCRGNGRVTKPHCVAIFRGSKLKDIVAKGYDSEPLFGAGQDMSLDKAERLFNHLIHHEALRLAPFQNSSGWHADYLQVCQKIDVDMYENPA